MFRTGLDHPFGKFDLIWIGRVGMDASPMVVLYPKIAFFGSLENRMGKASIKDHQGEFPFGDDVLLEFLDHHGLTGDQFPEPWPMGGNIFFSDLVGVPRRTGDTGLQDKVGFLETLL